MVRTTETGCMLKEKLKHDDIFLADVGWDCEFVEEKSQNCGRSKVNVGGTEEKNLIFRNN